MRSTQVMTLSPESIEQFRNWLSVRGLAEHTIKSYASDLSVFLQEGGHSFVALSQLEELGQKWMNATRAKVAPKTTGRRLTSFKSFAQFAGRRDLFLDYQTPDPGKSIPKPLAEGMDGVRRMIDQAADEEMRVCIGLLGFAGLRISEALALPPYNVDLRRKQITIRGKGDKTRTVPLKDELRELLIPIMVRHMGQPTLLTMEDRTARDRIKKLGVRVGLKYELSSHNLRATFATELLNQTGDLRLVQELLGHSSSKTTEGYTLVHIDRQRSAIENL